MTAPGYSDRVNHALAFAAKHHDQQVRRGTRAPYATHPANVAIILSGSATVREHVQRLGRILRKSGAKEALLYEVVTRGTVEEFASKSRRQHSAYGGGD